MQERNVSIGLKRMAVGLCAICLVCLGRPTGAGTESGTASANASANLRFVIHIPETLSMRIDWPERSGLHPVQNQYTDRLSGRPHESEQTVEIAILGNVLTGGTMAMSADTAVPQSDGQIQLNPGSQVTWTAKGFSPADNRSGKATGSGSADRPTPNTFTFSNTHHLEPGRIDRQIVYTISAP
jgi:hypothetical protein